MCWLSRNLGASNSLNSWGPVQACKGIALPLTYLSGKGGRHLGMTTLPPSCAKCHEIWEPQPPGTLEGLSRYCFNFYLFTWQRWQAFSDDNLTTFMCRLSRNLGASTSWNSEGLSRPVQACRGIALPFTYLPDKGGTHLGMTTLPPSCAKCHEIWKPQPSGTLRACSGMYKDCSTFYLFTWHHNVTSQKTSPIQLLKLLKYEKMLQTHTQK